MQQLVAQTHHHCQTKQHVVNRSQFVTSSINFLLHFIYYHQTNLPQYLQQ